MISKKMIEDLNAQMNAEVFAAQLYLSMSLDAWRMGCRGMSHWLQKQYKEEIQHAFKFISYLKDVNATVELDDIVGVRKRWECPKEMFEQALDHERKITRWIHNLCSAALKEEDYATFNFLQYFVEEQVEEESSVMEIYETLKCMENDLAALYAYDNQLLSR